MKVRGHDLIVEVFEAEGVLDHVLLYAVTEAGRGAVDALPVGSHVSAGYLLETEQEAEEAFSFLYAYEDAHCLRTLTL